ncbi:heat shock protein Hsp70 [Actinoplanes sp. SE50]|uniref:Hsp70 family protein n=1 Tax=unclassified Actinoplanes TaxID=2626549 RepID=UPI00023EDF52|nr:MULTISPECIES: Hsp70 family protein [unclassified Actinoplanes]AEV88282.1 heat shock protein 70 [Actinoplanes sp. SE50/110]ATO86687.1 heat shock protein Hsp70 [Actinoplanes sp. SE50]SLM04105.1 heat-shock protein Hsp70 [Actinoplanes sp. SE50/110]
MSIDQGGPKYALGIDFGTSNTVAVARWPDGRARPILVDGSPLLPSAVFAQADGTVLVGRDAVHSARLEPARFEPNPKRRVDDGSVLLGEQEFEVVDLITAVLARVVEEWHRAVGPYRPETTLTCPATWGATRRTLLAEAAARAGLSGVRLVAEPVAAATYFAEVLGRDVPIGSVLMVHDFGAGTFDASLVSRTATGFEVLAVDGRDDLGGLDVDAALVEHLRGDSWQRVLEPSTVEERRARRALWDDVRIAKERLSRAQSADFVVPLLDTEVHLTREELEQVARPVLEQTVRITQNLLKFADLPEGRLAGVFLVGGASRIPLMATLLHRELGEPPVVIEQPELVVAEGSILAQAALLTSEPAAPGLTGQMRLPSQTFGEETEVASVAPAPEPVEVTPVPAPAATPTPAAAETAPAATTPVTMTTPDPVDNRETEIRPELVVPLHLRPPVDPWADAEPPTWQPDPDATLPTSPSPAMRHTPVPHRQSAPKAAPQTTASGRAVVAPPPAPKQRPKPPQRAKPAPRQQQQPQRPTGSKRRRSRTLRFFQIVLSVLTMICVPLAALILSFGYGNGKPLQRDAVEVFQDIGTLLHLYQDQK